MTRSNDALPADDHNLARALLERGRKIRGSEEDGFAEILFTFPGRHRAPRWFTMAQLRSCVSHTMIIGELHGYLRRRAGP